MSSKPNPPPELLTAAFFLVNPPRRSKRLRRPWGSYWSARAFASWTGWPPPLFGDRDEGRNFRMCVFVFCCVAKCCKHAVPVFRAGDLLCRSLVACLLVFLFVLFLFVLFVLFVCLFACFLACLLACLFVCLFVLCCVLLCCVVFCMCVCVLCRCVWLLAWFGCV